MSVQVTTVPKATVIKEIRMVWQPYEERAGFWLIPAKGKRTEFHWLNEPRSGELDECENAISRLCKPLGIPFEKEER